MLGSELFAIDMDFAYARSSEKVAVHFARMPCEQIEAVSEDEIMTGRLPGLIDSPAILGGKPPRIDDRDDSSGGEEACYELNCENLRALRYKPPGLTHGHENNGRPYYHSPNGIRFDENKSTITVVFRMERELESADAVSDAFRAYRGWLDQCLEVLREAIDKHNALLRELARGAVEKRRSDCRRRAELVKRL